MNPNCLTVEEMRVIGSFPKNCPYVINDQEYQARKNVRDPLSLEELDQDLLTQYEELNASPHEEIQVYGTLRIFLCPRCKSPDLEEEWTYKYSLLYFKYKCNDCGWKGTNFNRQVQHSLKKLIPTLKNENILHILKEALDKK